MAVVKKTKMRAQTQLDNSTDVAGSDGHMILADGSVKMNSEYAISDRKAIAHSGFVATRLAALLGVTDSLSATISWTNAEAPLLASAASFKAALTTLSSELDDQALDITSLQDEVDETQAGAGLSVAGQYVASGSSTYIAAASSIHNATQILDYNLNQQATLRAAEMAAHEAAMASTGSASGSALVGYDGQAGANGLFTITPKKVDAALDDIVLKIDAEMKVVDDHVGDLLSSAGGAGKGAVLVGYDGHTGADGKLTVAAGTVRSGLDALAFAIDEDRFDLEAQTSNASGAKKIGYDGASGSNSKFVLAASKVDAALDSVVAAVDADIHAFDTFTGSLAATATGAGLIGYGGEDNSSGNNKFSVAAGSLEASLDLIVDAIDAEMQATDVHIAALAANATGGAMVGYNGKTNATNSLFSVSAGSLEASLDAIVQGIDSEMKATDDHIGALGATATGGALVGYHGKTGANNLLIVGAKQVDDALDQIVLFADAEAKVVDDHIADVANNADAAKGAAKVGFKAYTGTAAASTDGRAHFAIVGGTVKSALESIIDKVDQMESDDNVTGSVEYKIDQAVLAAIGGSAEMAGTLAQLSSSLNSLDDEAASSLSASIQNMILEVKSDLRDSVHVSLDSFEKVASRIESGAGSALATSASTLIEAINENHAELDDTQQGAGLAPSGAYAADGTRNYIGAASSLDDADDKLDAALKVEELARIAGDAGLQTEVDAIEGALGAMISAAGAYVAFSGKNYINGNGSVTEDLSDLDAQLKTATDAAAAAQAELDATQGALGTMVSAAGAYVAFSGKNYINGNGSVTEDLSDLDAALKVSMDNLGVGTSGLITWSGLERYVSDVNMKDAFVQLDTAVDAIEAAVIDLKAGNAAFVRKGDHVTEEFDAIAAQTLFTISAQAHQESVMVFINGMLQRMGSSYDWVFGATDDKISLQQASEAGDYVVIKYVKKTSA